MQISVRDRHVAWSYKHIIYKAYNLRQSFDASSLVMGNGYS
jgi:hypothetical protein